MLERIIKLHTKENDIILDCFGGSMSTAIACYNTKRQIVSCELDKNYYDKAIKRITNHTNQQNLFL
jgi:site-specific DNA-methyltransferase (adenine-specific)